MQRPLLPPPWLHQLAVRRMHDVTARRELITGGAGFIGSHLAATLATGGRDVVVIDDLSTGCIENIEAARAAARASAGPRAGRIELIEGEVAQRLPEVDASSVGSVYHLAAAVGVRLVVEDTVRTIETNVRETSAALDYARAAGVPILIASTSEVYGSAVAVPMAESHPICAQSPYAASKVAADAMVTAYWRSFGVPAVTVRPFNTYGPRQSTRAVLASIVAQLVSGADHIELGDLAPTRDLVYVEDTVSGFVAAAQAEGVDGRTFNLATGRDTSIGELARLDPSLLARLAG